MVNLNCGIFIIAIASIQLISGCSTEEVGLPNNQGGGNTTLSGSFFDGSGVPISGGNIRFDINNVAYQASTNMSGAFSIDFGGALSQAPSVVAGTAKAPGYVSQTQIIRINNGSLSGSGSISASSSRLTDKDVEVFGTPMGERIFHLGDASFTGSANSQLQVSSSGLSLGGTLSQISEAQINKYPAGLCFTFDARGVESTSSRPGIIKLNNQTSNLMNSPSDGSFGRQTHCFTDISGGEASKFNSLRIESGENSGDFDDFEIINITGLFSDRLPPKNLEIYTGNTIYRVGGEVTFYLRNISTSNPSKFRWNFGDGKGDIDYPDSSPIIVKYDTSGRKSVLISIFSSSNSIDSSASFSLDVEALPRPSRTTLTRQGDGSIVAEGPVDFNGANVRVTWPDGSIGEQSNLEVPNNWRLRSSGTNYTPQQNAVVQHFAGNGSSEPLIIRIPPQ